MTATVAKPHLVFFQWDHRPNDKAARFLSLHMALHVRCLQQSFEVTVLSEDCDYAEVCDRLQPDLCLFEAGYRTHGSRRLRITNTHRHADVPKLALHNGDPWCDRRAGLLADMDDWGIETIFAIGTATPAYLPLQAERIFVWPNFIDPEMFYDRGCGKVVPIMLTGQSGPLYPWRSAAYDQLSRHYPCLTTPPFRYEDGAAQRLLAGRAYAEALSASWISPSCGTMGHELVRKHLEIPGAGCLLLSEATPVLEAAGFRDGENCAFAPPGKVLERVDALMADPDRMRQICAAGHALVHDRHTLHHRTQIREWFDLHRRLGPGDRIVQPGPFSPLRIATAKDGRGHAPLPATGLD
ncbi:glycosyltransferase family 1 protein, partial [Thioclava sp. BHET1]